MQQNRSADTTGAKTDPNGFPFWTQVTVRWGDMDAMGHVNNTRYFTYLESARVAFFDQIGVGNNDVRQTPVVVSASCNYRRQLRYPAVVEVGLGVSHIGNSSFHFDYVMREMASAQLVADAHSVAAWFDTELQKAVPLPEALRRLLASYALSPS